MDDTGSNTFLLFSDVHFNPFTDASLVPKLAASDESAWKAIFSSSSQMTYPAYGEDSNYTLFESTLDNMAAQAGNVKTILYPGDILCHNFGKLYATLTGDTSQSGLNAFIQKTVQFFTQEVDNRFPTATVLVANGNIDSALDSIGSRPGDPYLGLTTASIAQTFFNNDADRLAFASTYSQNGSYAVEPDGPTGLKYIVLNDNLWADQYVAPGAGMEELSWFASELADSAQNSQKAYVVGHIPTGINTAAVVSNYEQTGKITYTGNLDDSYNNAFTALESAYSATIAATFTGHLHNDDFRLMGDGSGTTELTRIAPGVSPVFDSNPGYQVYTYDPESYSLLDETTYNLNLQSSTPTWGEEYNYAETYGQSLATPQAWQAVYTSILTNPVSLAAYVAYQNQDATSQNPITAANALIYLLAPGFTTSAAFNAAAAALAG